jgi:hypothetical protein
MLEKKNAIYVVLGFMVAAVAIVIAVDLLVGESRILHYGSSRAYHHELKQFMATIPLGTPESTIRTTFDATEYEHIVLSKKTKGSGYSIYPPIHFGSRGWALKINVNQGVVVSVRVRQTMDPEKRPFMAPKDQAYEGY